MASCSSGCCKKQETRRGGAPRCQLMPCNHSTRLHRWAHTTPPHISAAHWLNRMFFLHTLRVTRWNQDFRNGKWITGILVFRAHSVKGEPDFWFSAGSTPSAPRRSPASAETELAGAEHARRRFASQTRCRPAADSIRGRCISWRFRGFAVTGGVVLHTSPSSHYGPMGAECNMKWGNMGKDLGAEGTVRKLKSESGSTEVSVAVAVAVAVAAAAASAVMTH